MSCLCHCTGQSCGQALHQQKKANVLKQYTWPCLWQLQCITHLSQYIQQLVQVGDDCRLTGDGALDGWRATLWWSIWRWHPCFFFIYYLVEAPSSRTPGHAVRLLQVWWHVSQLMNICLCVCVCPCEAKCELLLPVEATMWHIKPLKPHVPVGILANGKSFAYDLEIGHSPHIIFICISGAKTPLQICWGRIEDH